MAQLANHTDSPPSANSLVATALGTPAVSGQDFSAEKPAGTNNRIAMRDTSPMSTWANIDVTVVYANWF
jgi:hypothetical protein